MKISNWKHFVACTLGFTEFILVFKPTWGQVGIAYSPFVQDGDDPGSTRYSRSDVKVMLRLAADKGYRQVTTYGVGTSSQIYRENETWKNSASVVHTAAAAAEINKESHNLQISVYQGLYMQNSHSASEGQLDSEINVGFEMAKLANNIFAGTMQGVVFPSITTVNEMFDSKQRISLVSSRTKNIGVKFGIRLSDCLNLNGHNLNPSEILKFMDFIICQMLPNKNHLISGPNNFFASITRDLEKVNKTIQSLIVSNKLTPIKIMLETGWPGGQNLGQSNTEVGSMLSFWSQSEQWSKEHAQQIFMHEAFDNPWKRGLDILYADHYGRWKHGEVNDNSRNAFELKVPEEPSFGLSKELIFGVVFGLILFAILAVLVFILYRRISQKMKEKLTEEEIRQFLNGTVTNEVVNEQDQDSPWIRMPYSQEFELSKRQFFIDKTTLLGSGAFGSVYKGQIDGLVNDVAFKMTRPDCPVSALRGLLSEIKILIYLGRHENVVSICGAYTAELSDGIVYVATELCSNGSLEKFLRASKSTTKMVSEVRYVAVPSSLNPEQISDYQLMRWAFEIASAMEYISCKKVIHADLATRNVLLTLDITAKVTDFGLSRRLYEYTEYVKQQQEPLPWRWMAIESLRHLKFSVESDVWSFGITLWEIFSLGDVPYPGLAWDINFVDRLESGLRMQKPSRASDKMYELIANCWNTEPAGRPTFSMLKDTLQAMINEMQNSKRD